MIIEKLTLTNFRQYSDTNSIDLRTEKDKNIILIGGKNGYGKTNLLMSLVWCLYGEDISKIDDTFKKEIQKEGNYSKYLKGSLNWEAEKKGITNFSVSIYINDMELPETLETKASNNYSCKLTRTFDTITGIESFDIKISDISTKIFEDSDYKRIFVNDYLIPIEAAKFVFFDAEKIASWAELTTREEGSVLNDALGKILGLDIYEGLITDLEIYSDGLRKESATSTVKQQITSTEKGIDLNIEQISNYENEIYKKEANILELKQNIVLYESFISKHGSINDVSSNLEDLYRRKKEADIREKELEIKFAQLSEVLPFAIAAGKLEEVVEHLGKQETSNSELEKNNEIIEKNNLLLEKLFNNPPFPSDGDISFSKKIFYAEKARKIVEEVFGKSIDSVEVEFEHDLNNSDRDLLVSTYNFVKSQSRDSFEETIESYGRIKNEISEIERLIRRIESDQQDEEVIKYSNNKNDAERRIEKLIEEKGALQNQIHQLRKAIEADSQRLQILIKKIEVSEQKKKKLDKANQYMKALIAFVDEQKRNKCTLLEKSIFDEMRKLMHKLSDSENDFVAAVKAEQLPDNDGIKITLLDQDGGIRSKESLSQGEKQLYISSLIKAILSLSIQELPIFIDTPLGRLDDEHIKNILLNYYPDLGGQVVLMATNNEIPPSRYKLMEENVAQTYLLDYSDNITKFKKGYFQSYEN